MPVRNAERSLDATIESIRAQSHDQWELIVVDDGSHDGSRALAARAAAADPRIRTIETPSRGIVPALVDGCAAARAETIARMDADDLMHPTRLERQLEFLDAHPDVGIVASLVRFGGDAAKSRGLAELVEWTNTLRTHDAMRLNRFVEAPVVHPSVTFRRALLDAHGGYEETGEPEDWALWLRWLHAGVRFGKVPEILLTWNDPPTRLTRSDPRYDIDRHAQLRCRHLAAHLRASDERRPIWLWGAGRVTRRRFDGLAHHGVTIAGFVDIDAQKIGQTIDGRPVVAPDEIPRSTDAFVITGVAVRGARELIRSRLLADGRVEGRDFLLAG